MWLEQYVVQTADADAEDNMPLSVDNDTLMNAEAVSLLGKVCKQEVYRIGKPDCCLWDKLLRNFLIHKVLEKDLVVGKDYTCLLPTYANAQRAYSNYPQNVEVKKQSGVYRLFWDPLPPADSYLVKYCRGGALIESETLCTTLTTTTNYLTLSGIVADTDYALVVVAYIGGQAFATQYDFNSNEV